MEKLDVSIVIPFYKKENEFKISLEKNYKQFEKAKEIIIVFDEPVDINRYKYIFNYNINYKLFHNNEEHPWRNPSIVINFGLKQATGKYCIVISPESILLESAIHSLVNECDDNTFTVGSILFTTYDYYASHCTNNEKLMHHYGHRKKCEKYISGFNYGSICCTRENLKKVGYYTADFIKKGWGGEDDDIRSKLEAKGISKKILDHAKLLHLEAPDDFRFRFLNVKHHIYQGSELKYDNFRKIY